MIKNIIIDECLSPGIAKLLHAYAAIDGNSAKLKFHHLREDLKWGGEPDDVWVPKIPHASTWMVITSDYGSTGKGDPLPVIAQRHGLAAVYLFGRLGERPMAEKGRAILAVWPKIEQLVLASPGSFRWRVVRVREHVFKLSQWKLSYTQRSLEHHYRKEAKHEPRS